jgi:dihydroorotate dehydrogenase electron transfer subunit
LPVTAQHAKSALIPLLSNTEIVPEVFLAAFEAPRIAAEARPGQFLMLSTPLSHDPLLPRPFAVFNVQGANVEILYKRVGKGTGLLSQMRKGDTLRILGPLGNGFTLPDRSVKAMLLAGGIGFASLHFLIVHLLKRQSTPPTLLYGVRCAEELMPLASLERDGLVVRIATEDGRQGVKGRVTRLLSDVLASSAFLRGPPIEAFACGPLPMLRAAADQMRDLGMKAQFSLESRMACGYGVCQGCSFPFKTRGGVPDQVRYRKVCTEGPVFAFDEIGWEALSE